MSLGNLFGGGKSTEALSNWKSPFVTPTSLNSSLDALGNTSNLVKGFTGGGLTGGFDASGNATVTPDASRTNLVSQLSGTYADQVAKLSDLASKIAPGYSDLRSAYLQDNTNRAEAAVSNLRDNLNARRVLGSSFAQDAINRTNATYGSERAQTLPQIYLQELAATNDLINQQSAASVNQYQTNLNESNLEAGVAGQLSQEASNAVSAATQLKAQILGNLANGAQNVQGENMRTAAKLDEQASAGAGSFLGNILQTAIGAALAPATGGASLLPTLSGWGATVTKA